MSSKPNSRQKSTPPAGLPVPQGPELDGGELEERIAPAGVIIYRPGF